LQFLGFKKKIYLHSGQAFYAGGSERSGQQIIGPPKGKDTDKKVTKIFEAARKQGAMELDEDANDRSTQNKAFGGVGYSLGDDRTPSRSFGESASAQAAAAASNRPEQVPLRFFSNGFTVGDGELRKFEDNQEFMEYIKRGEVPPELRSLSAGGRQVEVRKPNRMRTSTINSLFSRFVSKTIVAKNTKLLHLNSKLLAVLAICLARLHRMSHRQQRHKLRSDRQWQQVAVRRQRRLMSVN